LRHHFGILQNEVPHMLERKAEKLIDDHLYSRTEAEPFLGYPSTPTFRKMEREGLLKPIRLSKGPTAPVHYTGKNIRAAARGK
jgi:hypothetical protein